MSTTYGSDVYSSFGGYFDEAATSRAATRVAPSAMTGLGRGRLSPWYSITWAVCLFVFVCVLPSRCLVCRPSHLRVFVWGSFGVGTE